MSDQTTLIIKTECAECNSWDNEPLLSVARFDTEAEALGVIGRSAWMGQERWKPHPMGGAFIQSGSGSIWLVKLTDLALFTGDSLEQGGF